VKSTSNEKYNLLHKNFESFPREGTGRKHHAETRYIHWRVVMPLWDEQRWLFAATAAAVLGSQPSAVFCCSRQGS
jgi:hypothetical protein